MSPFEQEVSSILGAAFLDKSDATRSKYGTDWTREVQPNPLGVVRPTNTHEVSRFLQICSTHQVAVVPSGGRTGLAGGAESAFSSVPTSTTFGRLSGWIWCAPSRGYSIPRAY